MSDVIRYAMAGVGMMGREHIANIRALPGTQVVAIADTNTESLAQAQTITGLRDDSCFGTV
jgi:predicted homoserine dehydrogenase-like protein